MIIRDNYTAINTREELKRAVELGLTVYFSAKENWPDSGYIEARDVTLYFPGALGHFDWFRWRALGEHDLSEPKPEQPEQPERAQFALGDIVEIVKVPMPAQVEPGTLARVARIVNCYGVTLLGLEGPNGETLWDGMDGLLWAPPEHLAHADAPKDEQPEAPMPAESEKPEPAEESRLFENDLSPAKPEPLTNADLNPGDIVRHGGKEWRVQGIDDNDRVAGLLLLDTAEPKDSPDFYGVILPITRGSNRRPENGSGRRWRWAGAENVELVSRGEPGPAKPELKAEEPLAVGELDLSPAESEKPEPAEEPRSFFENDPVAFVREVLGVEPDQWQQDMLNAVARGERPSEPEFRITVVIEATSARGYREALTALGEGV